MALNTCDIIWIWSMLILMFSFQTHRMCLSTLLKYSPQTMTRLQNLIRGREAYIMTNVPHVDDLDIAQYLNVPIFSPEPEVAHLYSTKSGSKRIFASANVDMPPSEYDVYSLGLVSAWSFCIFCFPFIKVYLASSVGSSTVFWSGGFYLRTGLIIKRNSARCLYGYIKLTKLNVGFILVVEKSSNSLLYCFHYHIILMIHSKWEIKV